MQDAVGELGAQLAEVRATHAHAIAWRALTWVCAVILWQVRDGLRTCEAAEQTDSQGAQATIVTLEDRTIVLRMWPERDERFVRKRTGENARTAKTAE